MAAKRTDSYIHPKDNDLDTFYKIGDKNLECSKEWKALPEKTRIALCEIMDGGASPTETTKRVTFVKATVLDYLPMVHYTPEEIEEQIKWMIEAGIVPEADDDIEGDNVYTGRLEDFKPLYKNRPVDANQLSALMDTIKSHARITEMGQKLLLSLLKINHDDIQERIDVVTRVLGELSGNEEFNLQDLEKIRGYLGLLYGTDYEEFRIDIVNGIKPVTKLFRYKYDTDALDAPLPSDDEVNKLREVFTKVWSGPNV